MPRPKNRDELLFLSNVNYKKLFDLVSSFSDEEIHNEYIFDNGRDKNIRDIKESIFCCIKIYSSFC
ncbi:MAG TPA: ClbS/DfsB family four-helix bundle protein [Campylobacterales bacterium]|nr:ClbS/DfsB family four-helix bundle protein [Campylobacterales bacterium]